MLRLGGAPTPLALGALLVTARPVSAQSVREDVKQHLRQELDDKKSTAPPKTQAVTREPAQPAPPAPVPPRPPPAAPGQSVTFSFSSDAPTPAPPPPPGPPLPKRVFGRNFQLDVKVDGGYRGWLPQQYPTADVKVAGYYTWSVDLRARLFRYVNLHRGYYESNALASPRTEEAAVAAQIGAHAPKAAWLFAQVGFPFFQVWEPIVRYEARAFNTTATPKSPVCIVPRDASGDLADCPRTTDQLNVVSGMETLVAGVQYHPDKDPSAVLKQPTSRKPPFYFGVGLLSYAKPYQVTVDGATLGEYLFDGRFRGGGLAAGTTFDRGLRNFYGGLNLQVGLGQVSLTRDLILNALAPEDWLIGYVHGDLTIGYRFVLIEGPPTVLLTVAASGGGASFHFFQTKKEMGEPLRTPNLNWDFLYTARAALVIAL